MAALTVALVEMNGDAGLSLESRYLANELATAHPLTRIGEKSPRAQAMVGCGRSLRANAALRRLRHMRIPRAEFDVFLGMPYAYPGVPVTPGAVTDAQILMVAGVPQGYVVVYEAGQIGAPWSFQERLRGRVRVWLYEEGLVGRILLG